MTHANTPAPVRLAGLVFIASLAGQAPAQTSADIAPLHDFEKVRELFEPHGWRVEQGEKGYLNLYPPKDTAAASEEPGERVTEEARSAEPGAVAQVISLDKHQDLSGALAKHGWTVSTEEDGSLLLYPPDEREEETSEAADTATSALPEPLAGEVVSRLKSGVIELPIDSWGKARDMAEEWLRAHHLEGVQVGRIRQINRVYLVSIVESAHPFHLVAQLVIRAEDGAILRVA